MAPAETKRSFDAVIVGAGFSGLYQLHRLRADGLSVRIVEASHGVGGVWQNNRYPGARVDSHVPNYEYSLPEVWRDWTWTERFPGRDELVAYFDHVVSVLDLARDIDLGRRVEAAHYDETRRRWTLSFANEPQRYDCRFLILCTGFGSRPYVPELPGLADFGGTCHHTALWPEAGVAIGGQRVGIIGTGATAVQVIQEAAKEAAELTVFQRTPVTALPMVQRKLTAAEQQAAKPGYPEIFRRRNAPPGSFADIARLDEGALEVSEDRRREVYEDAWAKGAFHFWVGTFRDILMDEAANRTAYDFWRDATRARIDDPVTAAILAPSEPPYPFGTKRPSLEQDYYECFNQPNVHLVDLRTTPIESITPAGVRTSAGEHALDVLVLATGFDANTGGLLAIDIRGRGGRALADQWANGVDTHMGMAVHGFPNMLMLYGPQSTTAFCNGPVCAEVQGDWVADLLTYLAERNLTEFESTEESGLAWSDYLAMIADATLFGRTDSWYMGANIPGKRRQLLNLPMSDAYLERLADCAANGYDGFVLDLTGGPLARSGLTTSPNPIRHRHTPSSRRAPMRAFAPSRPAASRARARRARRGSRERRSRRCRSSGRARSRAATSPTAGSSARGRPVRDGSPSRRLRVDDVLHEGRRDRDRQEPRDEATRRERGAAEGHEGRVGRMVEEPPERRGLAVAAGDTAIDEVGRNGEREQRECGPV